MIVYWLELVAAGISLVSLVILVYGALIAAIAFVRNEIGRVTDRFSRFNIRRLRATFGTYMLLSLEFLIASDILKTVLEPNWNELAILGGVVVLRTVLSVFLTREIRDMKEPLK